MHIYKRKKYNNIHGNQGSKLEQPVRCQWQLKVGKPGVKCITNRDANVYGLPVVTTENCKNFQFSTDYGKHEFFYENFFKIPIEKFEFSVVRTKLKIFAIFRSDYG